MHAKENGPGKFYELFKVHKDHTFPELPPERPIVSGCGSITENISLFLDHHCKHLVPKLDSYLQDTPDLLRHLEDLKAKPLPPNTFPVSINVVGLYSNIPHREAVDTMREALNSREDQSIPTAFLITLLLQVLQYNVFNFGMKLFIQLIGIAMGTRAAPTIANIFMGKIDLLIRNCARSSDFDPILFFKRFIDDILLFWTGTVDEFNEFLAKINTLHPTIKFTASFDFETKSTTFLDTVISVIDGVIYTDLYRKKTDKVQYLLPSSCHPSHNFNNIPYSLALRLVRICSSTEALNKRFNELESMLLSRNYNRNVVRSAIERASKLDRLEVLKRVIKTESKRVIMVLRYNPKLISVSTVIKKHWSSMTKDPILKKIFPEPPMLAFKQPSNLRSAGKSKTSLQIKTTKKTSWNASMQ